MKTYSESTANIPGYIKEWAKAEKEMNEQTLAHQNALMLENIAVMNQRLAKQQQAMDETKADITTREAWLKANEKMIAADKNYADNTGNSVKIVDALNRKLKEQQEAFGKTGAELKKAEADVSALHHGYANAADAAEKLSKAAKAQAEAATKASQEEADAETKRFQSWAEQRVKQGEEYQKEVNMEAEEETKRFQHWAELQEKKKTLMHQMTEIEKEGYNTIMQVQSQAFAKMIVDGQSFASATAHLWKDLARQVIAQIEMMIAKYLVLMALTGGTGSFAGGSMMGKVFGMAEGGSVMVNKPTLFLAGEAGQPEVATFTPLSKMGGASIGSPQYMGNNSGSSMSIGSIVTYVTGVQDPMAIADQVGQAIVSRIRGRGDLNFVRS
jgi:hypothetical protein